MVTKLKIDRQADDRLADIIMNCANTTETTVLWERVFNHSTSTCCNHLMKFNSRLATKCYVLRNN